MFEKFPSIESLHKTVDNFTGKDVVITEKIDGTSFRIFIDMTFSTPRFSYGARNTLLNTENELA